MSLLYVDLTMSPDKTSIILYSSTGCFILHAAMYGCIFISNQIQLYLLLYTFNHSINKISLYNSFLMTKLFISNRK